MEDRQLGHSRAIQDLQHMWNAVICFRVGANAIHILPPVSAALALRAWVRVSETSNLKNPYAPGTVLLVGAFPHSPIQDAHETGGSGAVPLLSPSPAFDRCRSSETADRARGHLCACGCCIKPKVIRADRRISATPSSCLMDLQLTRTGSRAQRPPRYSP